MPSEQRRSEAAPVPVDEPIVTASALEGRPGDTIIINGQCPGGYDEATVVLILSDGVGGFDTTESAAVGDHGLFRIGLVIPGDALIRNPYTLQTMCTVGDVAALAPPVKFTMLPVTAPPSSTTAAGVPVASTPTRTPPVGSDAGTRTTRSTTIVGLLLAVALLATTVALLVRRRRQATTHLPLGGAVRQGSSEPDSDGVGDRHGESR